MANDSVTFAALKNQIVKHSLAPVYLFHGEEGYYIDLLVKLAEESVPEADRDFNLYILYAPQISPDTVMDTCRRYPMMADRQVVILKEAQAVPATYLKALKSYVESPSPTTALFIACRGAQAKSTDLTNAIKKSGGVVFESKKLKDSALANTIQEFIKEKGLSVDPKALAMLRDYVGSDLSRIYNEVDKLTVTLGAGAMITPEAIERNIGFSKDYNNFELIAAISSRDVVKSMNIIDYFKRNPKNNPTPVTATVLYNFFSNLLIAQYADDKSERGLMGALGFKWPGQLSDISRGMNSYKPAQVVEILSALHEFDNNSKGNGSRMDQYDLLRDLTYRILTATGRL